MRKIYALALMLVAVFYAELSPAQQNDSSWLIGVWEGDLQDFAAKGGQGTPARVVMITAVAPDGSAQGRMGIPGRLGLGPADVRVGGAEVIIVNVVKSVLNLTRRGDEQLVGTLTGPTGKVFELTLTRKVPPVSEATGVQSSPDALRQKLVGAWLVLVDGEMRTRTLEVKSLGAESGGRVAVESRYGWTGTALSPAPMMAAVRRDRVEITVATAAESVISAAEVGEQRLAGTITYKNGTTKAVTLAYASVEELARRRYTLTPNSKVTLIYVGASDCKFCLRWEGPDRGIFLKSPEAKLISYREVHAHSYTDTSREGYWPNDLKWVLEKTNAKAGTPRWIVLIDDRVVLNRRGLSSWDAPVHQLIKDLAAQKARQ